MSQIVVHEIEVVHERPGTKFRLFMNNEELNNEPRNTLPMPMMFISKVYVNVHESSRIVHKKYLISKSFDL